MDGGIYCLQGRQRDDWWNWEMAFSKIKGGETLMVVEMVALLDQNGTHFNQNHQTEKHPQFISIW